MPISAKNVVAANAEAIKKKIKDGIGQQQREWRVNGHDRLVLVTRPTGRGVFYFIYRPQHGKKQRKLRLGEFPSYTLAEAIKDALERRLQVEKGGDPALDRTQQNASLTFQALAQEFLTKGSLSATTQQTYKWTFDKDVYPQIGDKPASAVTEDDIFAICAKIRSRGAVHQPQRTKTAISGAYDWGRTRGYVKSNPTKNVPYQGDGESRRDRVPSDDEIRAIWHAPTKTRMSLAMTIIIKLGILLGQRRTQIAGTRVSELKDLDGTKPTWVIKASEKRLGKTVLEGRMKNKTEQRVYLSRQAAMLFAKASQECSFNDYVFPAATDRVKEGRTRKPHIHGESVSKAVARICESENIDDVIFHDMRRAITTHLGNRGDVSESVQRMILHHEAQGVTGRVYDQASRESQLRHAWQLWADHVEKIVCISQSTVGDPPAEPSHEAEALFNIDCP